MYLATNKNPYKDSELPVGCTFTESDWHILAGFWHPVAFSSEVQDKPFKARLLDVDLVVYRTVEGITAAKDICVHRGSALSLGRLDYEGKNIICPMHGLHYDHTGQCTKIPSMDPSKRIPDVLKLVSYQVQERYGLVWVCMKDEATRPLPEWPRIEEDGTEWSTFFGQKGLWHTSASRHVENFNDIAHYPWVHKGSFGNPNPATMPIGDYEVWDTDAGLSMKYGYTELARLHFDRDEGGKEIDAVYTKHLTYPFAIELIMDRVLTDGSKQADVLYDISTPRSAREIGIYQIMQTNVPNPNIEDYIEYMNFVSSEDIPIVESQRPEQLPLNIAAELHIPADKFSIQYRRQLVDLFGLGSPELIA